LLINLMRNAADACLEMAAAPSASVGQTRAGLEIAVEDEGPGLSNTRICSCRSSPRSQEDQNGFGAGRHR
jgi:C4-dicarboxylate-specific signal transduction histidine kinase